MEYLIAPKIVSLMNPKTRREPGNVNQIVIVMVTDIVQLMDSVMVKVIVLIRIIINKLIRIIKLLIVQ